MSRMGRQIAIEQAIVSFAPDFDEAKGLIDALTASLAARFGNARMVVVEEEAKALKVAMDEAAPCEISPEDLRYDARMQEEIDQ